jgi:hypothetical protein
MSFTVGSLVQARGREWVVLPDSSEDLLMLKPLGGRDEEVTGILPQLETIAPASFQLPNPSKPGDFRSARLLREAARLGFRGSAGHFRSFGRIAVEPRHYQLVPLLVALKQDLVLQENTPFPDREERELDYQLTPEYRQLFKRALDSVRESVTEDTADRRRQRVRWWSALALLRSLASSSAAAASTLRSRAKAADAETPEDAEEIGREAVMDLTDDEPEEFMDAVPGADLGDKCDEAGRVRRRLQEMARTADKLAGKADAKLQIMIKTVRNLVSDGYNPILFCRFIPTAEYLAEHAEWENVSDREKRSRTLFAQETIKPDEVARELRAIQAAIGRGSDVRWFLTEAVRAYGGSADGGDTVDVDPRELPPVVRDLMPAAEPFAARFELPVTGDQIYLNRAHPAVEGLASFVLESALDPGEKTATRRSGVIRTSAVTRRTTLLLVRIRFAIKSHRSGRAHEALAEDLRLLAFEGAPSNVEWLDEETSEALLAARPEGNVAPGQAESFLRKVIDGFDALLPALDEAANARAEVLLESHLRVREASRAGGRKPAVEPFLPVDVLGIYVYLPVGG